MYGADFGDRGDRETQIVNAESSAQVSPAIGALSIGAVSTLSVGRALDELGTVGRIHASESSRHRQEEQMQEETMQRCDIDEQIRDKVAQWRKMKNGTSRRPSSRQPKQAGHVEFEIGTPPRCLTPQLPVGEVLVEDDVGASPLSEVAELFEHDIDPVGCGQADVKHDSITPRRTSPRQLDEAGMCKHDMGTPPQCTRSKTNQQAVNEPEAIQQNSHSDQVKVDKGFASDHTDELVLTEQWEDSIMYAHCIVSPVPACAFTLDSVSCDLVDSGCLFVLEGCKRLMLMGFSQEKRDKPYEAALPAIEAYEGGLFQLLFECGFVLDDCKPNVSDDIFERLFRVCQRLIFNGSLKASGEGNVTKLDEFPAIGAGAQKSEPAGVSKGKGKAAPPPKGKGKGKGKGKNSKQSLKNEFLKEDVRPDVRLKKLFWNRICLDGSGSENGSCIWGKLHQSSLEFNAKELEQHFADAAPGTNWTPHAHPLSPRGSEPSTPRFSSKLKCESTPRPLVRCHLLEEHRRRQIWFALAIMPSVVDVLSAVEEMDDSIFPAEKVELLLSNLPTCEEEKLLRNAPTLAEDECWDVPEDFMMRLIEIPSYASRIQVWAFLNSFEVSTSRLSQACDELANACEVLQTSPRIEQLLSLVLCIGNYLNGGTARGRADGFELEILPKLGSLKATFPEKGANYTLVDFIVHQAEHLWPGLLREVYSPGMEFDTIRNAKRHRASILKREISELGSEAAAHLRIIEKCDFGSPAETTRLTCTPLGQGESKSNGKATQDCSHPELPKLVLPNIEVAASPISACDVPEDITEKIASMHRHQALTAEEPHSAVEERNGESSDRAIASAIETYGAGLFACFSECWSTFKSDAGVASSIETYESGLLACFSECLPMLTSYKTFTGAAMKPTLATASCGKAGCAKGIQRVCTSPSRDNHEENGRPRAHVLEETVGNVEAPNANTSSELATSACTPSKTLDLFHNQLMPPRKSIKVGDVELNALPLSRIREFSELSDLSGKGNKAMAVPAALWATVDSDSTDEDSDSIDSVGEDILDDKSSPLESVSPGPKRGDGFTQKLSKLIQDDADAGAVATPCCSLPPKPGAVRHYFANHRVDMLATRLAELQELSAKLETVEGKYARLRAWYRDDGNARPTDDFFCLWDRFLDDAKKALAASDKRRAEDERHERCRQRRLSSKASSVCSTGSGATDGMTPSEPGTPRGAQQPRTPRTPRTPRSNLHGAPRTPLGTPRTPRSYERQRSHFSAMTTGSLPML